MFIKSFDLPRYVPTTLLEHEFQNYCSLACPGTYSSNLEIIFQKCVFIGLEFGIRSQGGLFLFFLGDSIFYQLIISELFYHQEKLKVFWCLSF